MKTRWLQFFDALSQREQRMLSIGLVGIVLYLAYLSYMPLQKAVLENTVQLAEKKGTLLWMRSVQKKRHPSLPKTKKLENESGLAVFSEALSESSFHTFSYQLEQLSDGALLLAFESVPYQAFLTWLWAMEAQYTLDIKTVDVIKTDQPGLVKLSITVNL